MRMRKLEHCTLCLPQLSIVGYSRCCEEAITTLLHEWRFPGEEKKVMFAKWRYDIKYKMAISWLECVENVLAGESGIKVR